MKNLMIVLILLLTIIGLIFGFLIWNGTFFTINRAEFPDYPETMYFYTKTNETEILIGIGDYGTPKITDGFPTECEAESMVKNYLLENNIFPDGAIFRNAQMQYIYSSNEYGSIEKTPHEFCVSFSRILDGVFVFGCGNEIFININYNGYISHGAIFWNNYSLAGEAVIISPELDYEKLLAREDLARNHMSYPNIAIDEISLCYYYIDRDSPFTMEHNNLMPVWRFKGDENSYFVKGYSSYSYIDTSDE